MSAELKALNTQVAEAVAAVRQALEADSATVERVMTATATRHACSIALHDAVDHLRHTQILATAATARALSQMADGDRVEESEKVLQQARDSVKAAVENLSDVMGKLGSWLGEEKDSV